MFRPAGHACLLDLKEPGKARSRGSLARTPRLGRLHQGGPMQCTRMCLRATRPLPTGRSRPRELPEPVARSSGTWRRLTRIRRPGRAPAAHRVHHDVGRLQMRNDVRMLLAFHRSSPSERFLLGRGPRDLDQRHRRAPPAGGTSGLARRRRRHDPLGRRRPSPLLRGLDPRRLVRLASRTGAATEHRRTPRPRAAPTAPGAVPAELRGVVDPGPRVAVAFEPLRDRPDRERVRPAARHLTPGERRRHAAVRGRPHRVRRRNGSVLRVLVVVEEHAVPLLLPPLARREVRFPPFDLARERDRRTPDLRERPPSLDPRVDVHAAGPRRLGPRRQAELLEDLTRRERHLRI